MIMITHSFKKIFLWLFIADINVPIIIVILKFKVEHSLYKISVYCQSMIKKQEVKVRQSQQCAVPKCSILILQTFYQTAIKIFH